ncbi:hypothetical protein ACFCXT_04375 [Streptomyces vinaceus]|uniref:hypothetical protein n=1 Tax=Streptomyces vinaceus TaxID=1960 RepID=UPI0035D7793D
MFGYFDAHEDFLLLATAHTYGHGGDHQYVGRQALDAATPDRFTVIDVPIDTRLEYRLVLANAPSRPDDARRLLQEVRKLRAVAAERRLPLAFSPRAGSRSRSRTVRDAMQDRVGGGSRGGGRG